MTTNDDPIAAIRAAAVSIDNQLRQLEDGSTGHSERMLINRCRSNVGSLLDALNDLRDVTAAR